MSAGDIDDRLGPEGELDRLKAENTELRAYLETINDLEIDTNEWTIPYGFGISTDGRVRYGDHRLNCFLDGVDISIGPATHESVEWAVRRFCGIGEDYAHDARGHRLANRAEYEVVASLFPNLPPDDAWDKYDDFLDPQIRKIEHAPLTKVPSDLALYPYEDANVMMRRLHEAMEPTVYDIPPEPSAPPPTKITRDAFLYMEPEDDNPQFAQCDVCRFVVRQKDGLFCALMGLKEVKKYGSCALFVDGPAVREMLADLDPKVIGYVEKQVRCENCKFGGGSLCELYVGLNAMSRVPGLGCNSFHLNPKIHPQGCCNAWQEVE